MMLKMSYLPPVVTMKMYMLSSFLLIFALMHLTRYSLGWTFQKPSDDCARPAHSVSRTYHPCLGGYMSESINDINGFPFFIYRNC